MQNYLKTEEILKFNETFRNAENQPRREMGKAPLKRPVPTGISANNQSNRNLSKTREKKPLK